MCVVLAYRYRKNITRGLFRLAKSFTAAYLLVDFPGSDAFLNFADKIIKKKVLSYIFSLSPKWRQQQSQKTRIRFIQFNPGMSKVWLAGRITLYYYYYYLAFRAKWEQIYSFLWWKSQQFVRLNNITTCIIFLFTLFKFWYLHWAFNCE